MTDLTREEKLIRMWCNSIRISMYFWNYENYCLMQFLALKFLKLDYFRNLLYHEFSYIYHKNVGWPVSPEPLTATDSQRPPAWCLVLASEEAARNALCRNRWGLENMPRRILNPHRLLFIDLFVIMTKESFECLSSECVNIIWSPRQWKDARSALQHFTDWTM